MSLSPYATRCCYGPTQVPRHFHDDDFAGSLFDADLVAPAFYHQHMYPHPASSIGSRQGAACTPHKFSVRVDARHFAPEEITVKTEDHCVVVHGRHEEKSEDRGCYVMREFTRRYELPDDVDPHTVKCHLTPEGHLALEAPRKNAPKSEQAKPIPIQVQHSALDGSGDKK